MDSLVHTRDVESISNPHVTHTGVRHSFSQKLKGTNSYKENLDKQIDEKFGNPLRTFHHKVQSLVEELTSTLTGTVRHL